MIILLIEKINQDRIDPSFLNWTIKFFRYPTDRNEIGEINFKNLFKIKALKNRLESNASALAT